MKAENNYLCTVNVFVQQIIDGILCQEVNVVLRRGLWLHAHGLFRHLQCRYW